MQMPILRTLHKLNEDGLYKTVEMTMSIAHKIAGPYLYYYKYKIWGQKALAKPFKKIYIDPKDVNKVALQRPLASNKSDIIANGNWDKKTQSIENNILHQSIYSRYKDGVPWNKTKIYQHRLFNETGATEEYLNNYYRDIDKLYDEIKTNGYLSNRIGLCDHIGVYIGRNGEIIRASPGRHRYSIARILELDEIPVRVRVRHTQWQTIREKYRNTKVVDDVYTRHPDMEDIV